MSSETLQQQFNEYANHILRAAYRAFLQDDDVNILENFHIQNLITLSSRCYQIQQHHNTQAIVNFLHDVNYLKTRLQEKIELLNHNTSTSPIKRFVKKIQTGGRPKFVINIEAVKLLREQGLDWTKIGKTFGV